MRFSDEHQPFARLLLLDWFCRQGKNVTFEIGAYMMSCESDAGHLEESRRSRPTSDNNMVDQHQRKPLHLGNAILYVTAPSVAARAELPAPNGTQPLTTTSVCGETSPVPCSSPFDYLGEGCWEGASFLNIGTSLAFYRGEKASSQKLRKRSGQGFSGPLGPRVKNSTKSRK